MSHTMRSVNPATGQVLETYEELSDGALEERLALAASAFREYRRTSLDERRDWLEEAAGILDGESRRWAELMTLEMGKPIAGAVAEVEKCALALAEAEVLAPDVVITPVVGFDRACYRLGYGGGYYDRTLASLPERPLVVGVGYAQAALDTIYPQPHDVPLDLVVTERGRPCAHEGERSGEGPEIGGPHDRHPGTAGCPGKGAPGPLPGPGRCGPGWDGHGVSGPGRTP